MKGKEPGTGTNPFYDTPIKLLFYKKNSTNLQGFGERVTEPLRTSMCMP